MTYRIELFLIILILASCDQSSSEDQHASEKMETEPKYASTRYLIEPEELAESIGSESNLKLIDIRRAADYDDGHIAGATNVWRDQITDTSYHYGGMMPTKEQLEELLGRLGILPEDTIILYDDKAECDAARLWWILKCYGHTNMKLLNGGLRSWKLIDSTLSKEEVMIEPTEYRFSFGFDSTLLASHGFVRSMFNDSSSILLDTRSEAEYLGDVHKNGAASAGRIPNAINLDWANAVDYNGDQRFLSAKLLKERYAALGIDDSRPVVTYCHSGVRSANTLFLLTELLGYENVRNYDGSWTEWSHLEAEK